MILLQATNKVILIHLGEKNLLLAERAVGRFLKAEACFFMSQGKTLLVLVWL